MEAATEAVLTGRRADAIELPAPVAISADTQTRLTGSYRNGRANGFDIFAKDGGLRLRSIAAAGDATNGVPMQRLGTKWYVAGNNRFAIVTGADGKTMYLVTGLRAMRKQD